MASKMASLPAFLVLPLQSTSALEPTRSFHLKLNHVILTSETYQLFSTAFKKESRLVLCGAHLFLHSTTSTSSHTVLHPTYTDTHTHTHPPTHTHTHTHTHTKPAFFSFLTPLKIYECIKKMNTFSYSVFYGDSVWSNLTSGLVSRSEIPSSPHDLLLTKELIWNLSTQPEACTSYGTSQAERNPSRELCSPSRPMSRQAGSHTSDVFFGAELTSVFQYNGELVIMTASTREPK